MTFEHSPTRSVDHIVLQINIFDSVAKHPQNFIHGSKIPYGMITKENDSSYCY